MIVHGCQLDIVWENKPENFKRVRSLLNSRKVSPGSLVVLPEMFATGFSMNAGLTAEPRDGVTLRFLRELAEDRRAYVLGGLVRRGGRQRTFNEAVCIAPSGRCAARYDKLQLFTPGCESRHYTAGRDVTLFRWGKLKVAMLICYDLRFPELFRLGVQQGAEAFVVIANWPERRHSHWPALLQARAIENQAYVIGVNRCGRDPESGYAGGSVVIDPRGRTMASSGRKETIVSARLNPSFPSRWRLEFPVLQDIRTAIRLKPCRKVSAKINGGLNR